MKVTMIGHSTVLIEAAGTKILTDPYFGSWGNLAYKRIAPPFKTRGEMAAVDLVLVSHNHWDHTDSRYFRALAADLPVVAPRVAAWITRAKGAKNVVGLGKWEQRRFGSVAVTAVPALHMGLPGGFLIEAEGKHIYFAGDTYYGGFMKEIGKKFPLVLALMPVTTFRIPMTMGEKSAVRAVEALRPRTVIPIHLGILPRSPLLRTGQTPEGFSRRVREAGLKTEVVILREGESWTGQD
ncbi:MAG: MBL fold metallo-hydrolase [Terracidiphilus sp.]|jgi:L-ascorbate metabolism protein UlaG (beta-lactamase superfamily)